LSRKIFFAKNIEKNRKMCYNKNMNNLKNPTELTYEDYLALKKLLSAATKSSRVHINRIVGLAHALTDAVSADAVSDTENNAERAAVAASELLRCVYKLLSQNINLSYICSEDVLPELPQNVADIRNDAEIINTAQVLTRIADQASEILAVQGGTHSLRLQISADARADAKTGARIGAKIPEKLFTLAVMNLLQNAFLYSPPESEVELSLNADKNHAFISVNIINTSGVEAEVLRAYSNSANEECAGLGIPLTSKIAVCYGGNLEFIRLGTKIIARFSLPLINFAAPVNSYSTLESEQTEYEYEYENIANHSDPIWIFMQEVVKTQERTD
jgi:K+-sensing histidine kinase KdpD